MSLDQQGFTRTRDIYSALVRVSDPDIYTLDAHVYGYAVYYAEAGYSYNAMKRLQEEIDRYIISEEVYENLLKTVSGRQSSTEIYTAMETYEA